jgi:alpha/beta superfamily hydrolase
MINRVPVKFRNKAGLNLFGILHRPQISRENGITIILLSPGVKMRVGPHNLYIKMTKLFLDMGFSVLRFDFFGLGDSEGELEEDMLADVYNHIEVGRYVDDTIISMDWLEKNYGFNRFILGGLCGGAITALLAASRDNRVVGILSLGMTSVLASFAADPAKYITQGQLKRLRDGYLRKLLKPKSWIRLLTLQSDYWIILKSTVQPLFKRIKVMLKLNRNEKTTTIITAKSIQDNSNPLFASAFFRCMERNIPILLIFSGADRLYWEFEEKFMQPRKDELDRIEKKYFSIHIVDKANHVFSFKEWQDEMLGVSKQWLTNIQITS